MSTKLLSIIGVTSLAHLVIACQEPTNSSRLNALTITSEEGSFESEDGEDYRRHILSPLVADSEKPMYMFTWGDDYYNFENLPLNTLATWPATANPDGMYAHIWPRMQWSFEKNTDPTAFCDDDGLTQMGQGMYVSEDPFSTVDFGEYLYVFQIQPASLAIETNMSAWDLIDEKVPCDQRFYKQSAPYYPSIVYDYGSIWHDVAAVVRYSGVFASTNAFVVRTNDDDLKSDHIENLLLSPLDLPDPTSLQHMDQFQIMMAMLPLRGLIENAVNYVDQEDKATCFFEQTYDRNACIAILVESFDWDGLEFDQLTDPEQRAQIQENLHNLMVAIHIYGEKNGYGFARYHSNGQKEVVDQFLD